MAARGKLIRDQMDRVKKEEREQYEAEMAAVERGRSPPSHDSELSVPSENAKARNRRRHVSMPARGRVPNYRKEQVYTCKQCQKTVSKKVTFSGKGDSDEYFKSESSDSISLGSDLDAKISGFNRDKKLRDELQEILGELIGQEHLSLIHI